MKTIGVLGGMGPQASVRFYELLIGESIHVHGAKTNADFPHIILSNIPVPDLIGDRHSENLTVGMVQREAKKLADAGADFLVLPCNTMHLYAGRFAEAAGIPLVSMIDAVVERVFDDRVETIGILGSQTTMVSGLYEVPLKEKGIRAVIPDESDRISTVDIIRRVIAGSSSDQDREKIMEIMGHLVREEAEAVIIGCTELPLLLRGSNAFPLPQYDSLSLLARKTCLEAR